jgi:hypothetical protein
MKEGAAVLFGRKDQFAIEIKPNKVSSKFFLRLWFKNKAIGNFKSAGSLDYLINRYFTLLSTFNELYEHTFTTLSDWEIFDNILMYEAKDFSIEDKQELFERSKRYDFTIAENQMNEFSILVFYKGGEELFKFLIYKMDGKTDPEFYSFEIEKSILFESYKSFMVYALKSGLKKRGSFFPENYSCDDIK